jgi:uncharacterized membrane protein
METNRVEAFSDGVFAIVITLIILEIEVPHVEVSHLKDALFALGPKFFAYALSFIIIGVYWVAHHNMFNYIKKVDRTSLWLNNFTLLFIGFIPFPTALLGGYPYEQLPVVVYGLTLAVVNGMGTLFWIYSTKNNRMTGGNLSTSFIRFVTFTHSMPIMCYLVAIGFSYININVSYIIYALVPLFFILPNPLLNKRLSNPYM